MDLGKRQVLEVLRIKDFGAYLGESADSQESVLLPKKELGDVKVGDKLDVFLYKDSSDRLISTLRPAKLQCGELGRLKVKDVGKVGAFLDMGLERDLLLPYKEMEGNPIAGDDVLVYMYVDRSGRLAATMRIYPYLQITDIYKKDDEVTGTVYQNKNFEYLIAVDDKYYGAVPKKEVFDKYAVGMQIKGRVIKVREDGKLDISPRMKAYKQIEEDSALIYKVIEERDGSLGFDDKADPELIKSNFKLSKNAFKRAVGHLLKEGKIIIENNNIKKIG